MKLDIIAKGLGACLAVWLVTLAGSTMFGGMKPSVNLIKEIVTEADLEDWGGQEQAVSAGRAKEREKVIRRVAKNVNALGFAERERARNEQVLEDLFERLSFPERELFVELTLVESMNKAMEALDRMPQDERQRFVEERLAEIKEGQSAEEMERVQEMGDDLIAKASREGFRAYMDKASVETKMDLAPLMEAMNEMLQGLTGPQSFSGGVGQ